MTDEGRAQTRRRSRWMSGGPGVGRVGSAEGLQMTGEGGLVTDYQVGVRVRARGRAG